MTAPVEEQLRQAIVAIRSLRQQVEALRSERRPAIAVVGIGCRLPGGVRGPDALWRMLMDGTDAIAEVPPERWDAAAWYDANPETPGKMNTRWGGFLGDIDQFDAAFFELSSREASAMDPQQRLLLEAAWEALEDAAIAPDALAGSATGVFVGINGSDYYQMAMAAPGGIDAHAISGGVASVAAGRLSYLLGLQGPAMAIDTACSSSLSAVHLAVNSLRSHESRVALAGGVYTVLQPNLSVGLSKLRMMAPDGRCKTFDASADGFVQGEGCALVVLKRLDDALADHDRIHAVIRGSAMNQDGRSSSLTAPSRSAQAAVIRAALQDAAITPSRIGYVETHGTGTALGDPIEVHALGDALGRERSAPVVLGALKSNIGHLGPAAGVAGLLKAVLAVRHGTIPANLHLHEVNPEIAAETMPLQLPSTPTAWPVEGARAAGVSSFGFSGTNVHVVLEECTGTRPAAAALPGGLAIVCASARTEAALQASIAALLETLHDGADLAAIARASTIGRRAFEHRVAVVASNVAQARAALSKATPQRALARPRLALRFADSNIAPHLSLKQQAALLEQLRAWNVAPAIVCTEALRQLSPSEVAALAGDAAQVDTAAALEKLGATFVLDLGTLDAGAPPHIALLPAMAMLHMHGVSPDWRKVLGDGPRAQLPLYPFQRTRHWRDFSTVPGSEAVRLPSWPPGERVASPSSEAQFRLALGVEVLPWLADHRVHGMAIVPGAFQVACLEGAWRATHGATSCTIESLTFPRPLVAPESGTIELWTLLAADGRARLVTHVEGRWIEHAQAQLHASHDAAPADLELHAKRLEPVAPPEWRAQLATLGISIGPAFHGLRRLWRGDGEAVGEARLPEPCVVGEGAWHPALLDACLQVAGGALAAGIGGGEALLPLGIDRIECRAPLAGNLRVHARCTSEGAVMSTDLTICDDEGRLRARVTGLHVRRAPLERVRADDSEALFHAMDWVASAPSTGAAQTGRVVVLAQDEATARDLIARLARPASLVTDDAALQTLDASEVIDLRAFDAGDVPHEGRALTTLRALASLERSPRLTFATRSAVIESRHPRQATLWGLAATAALEHPALAIRCVDADCVAALAAELGRPRDEEPQIAWRDGVRHVARLAARRPSQALAPRLRDAILITGGLGGLGRVLARWAVERGASHVVLAGRRAADADATTFMRSLGVPAHYVRADISRRDEVARLVRECDATAPLRTVMHAAGIQSEGLLAAMAPERFMASLDAKLTGACWLHEETQGRELDHFILCSSIASVLGAAGQGGYAAANAGLDALARHRRDRGLPALSIAWGRWNAPGMTDALDEPARKRIDALGIEAMATTTALAALDRAIATGLVDPVVAAVDWNAYRARHPAGKPPCLLERLGRDAQEAVAALPSDFDALETDQRIDQLTALLAERVAAALQAPRGEPVDTGRALVQLGLDSLMAMELRNRMQRELGVAASIADLLGGASVAEIAQSLERAMPRGKGAAKEAAWEEFRL